MEFSSFTQVQASQDQKISSWIGAQLNFPLGVGTTAGAGGNGNGNERLQRLLRTSRTI